MASSSSVTWSKLLTEIKKINISFSFSFTKITKTEIKMNKLYRHM